MKVLSKVCSYLGTGFFVAIVAFFVAPKILRVQKLTTAAAKIATCSLMTEQAGSSKAGGSKVNTRDLDPVGLVLLLDVLVVRNNCGAMFIRTCVVHNWL